jgi:hypothetical protein
LGDKSPKNSEKKFAPRPFAQHPIRVRGGAGGGVRLQKPFDVSGNL